MGRGLPAHGFFRILGIVTVFAGLYFACAATIVQTTEPEELAVSGSMQSASFDAAMPRALRAEFYPGALAIAFGAMLCAASKPLARCVVS